MNMATQLMSDPQMQNVMSNLVTTMFNPNQAGSGADAAQSPMAPATDQSTTSSSEANPGASPAGGIPGMPNMGGGFDSIFQSAQNWASQMNPEFIQQMRE